MASKPGSDYEDLFGASNSKGYRYQIGLSLSLGIVAFLSFCVLRPRWTALYAARKRQKDEAIGLPELSPSLFGWMWTLWNVTDQQVLASAGLDAYVFLQFFKMAIRFLAITLFFSLVVIKPVHDANPDPVDKHGNKTKMENVFALRSVPPLWSQGVFSAYEQGHNHSNNTYWWGEEYSTDYLWMYLIFAYFFSGLAGYFVITETKRIIEVRQEYLGCQTTLTDRTIRLSGVPPDLRSEEKIKQFIEDLEIGRVESVSLCKNWKELDEAMVHRHTILRRLEEAWTVYMGVRRVERTIETLPIVHPSPPGPDVGSAAAATDLDNPWRDEETTDEESQLVPVNGSSEPASKPYEASRPQVRLWHGWFSFKSKKIDAIDYYEEKLRRLDDRIRELRKKEFVPTSLAFVTLDSVASAQMAVQAALNPLPLQLIAKPSPAPSDVVWHNTYITRSQRMTYAWSITALITVLTIFWSVLLVPLAGALNLPTIQKVWPELGQALKSRPELATLVSTQLPTLLAALFNVIVPYLYDWLSNYQGMISQGDVELSVISKNFFFTFFNFFIVFTVLGTASGLVELINNSIRDIGLIANRLAVSLARLLDFYANYIILQGIGLLPFRLLEFGSVALYPILMLGAKTPRDYAELVQPPLFNYGFYLPSTLLIFIICIVYSVLRDSWKILLSGLVYFLMGSFVYKYQLLYAMDHPHHSTGKGWSMICNRIIVGVFVFQFTVAGELALKQAPRRSALIIPLMCATVWFAVVYRRAYDPLMKYIALRSIRRAEQQQGHINYRDHEDSDHEDSGDDRGAGSTRQPHDSRPVLGRPRRISAAQETAATMARIRRHSTLGRGGALQPAGTAAPEGRTLDESREYGLRFVNPSLVAPLKGVWIADVASEEDQHQDDGAGDEGQDRVLRPGEGEEDAREIGDEELGV